jgi:hypothetical protein
MNRRSTGPRAVMSAAGLAALLALTGSSTHASLGDGGGSVLLVKEVSCG